MSTVLLVMLTTLLAAQEPAGILLERRLATELSAEVGDTVFVRPLSSEGPLHPFVVEGIHERSADPNRIARNELEARFHLPDLERMLGEHDQVDRFALVLRADADSRGVASWIQGLAYGTRVFAAADLADEASSTFQVVSRFHDAIGFVTMLASSIFLLCLMVIRVDERRGDVRTMRLVGISRRTIFLSVVLEAVIIAGIAAIAGVLLGALMTTAVNAYYGAFYDTTLRFALLTPSVVRLAVVIGIVLGVAAGALAALRIVRLPPQKLGER